MACGRIVGKTGHRFALSLRHCGLAAAALLCLAGLAAPGAADDAPIKATLAATVLALGKLSGISWLRWLIDAYDWRTAMLVVGVAAALLSGSVGVVLGLLAGYVGGWCDGVLSRLADIQQAIPFLILAIAVAVIVGPSLSNVILVLAVTAWVNYFRVVRAEVLGVRELALPEPAGLVPPRAHRVQAHDVQLRRAEDGRRGVPVALELRERRQHVPHRLARSRREPALRPAAGRTRARPGIATSSATA